MKTTRGTWKQRLFNDDWRSWIATLPAVLIALVISVVVVATRALTSPESAALYLLGMLLGVWAVFGATYVALTHWLFASLDHGELHEQLRRHRPRKPRGFALLVSTGGHTTWSLTAASVAVVLIVAVLASPYARGEVWVYGLAVGAVASCWLLLTYSMALAYGRINANPRDDSGVTFAGIDQPAFSDYVAASMMLSATLDSPAVSLWGRDALTTSRTHGVTAFVFNSVVIALLVAVLLSQFG